MNADTNVEMGDDFSDVNSKVETDGSVVTAEQGEGENPEQTGRISAPVSPFPRSVSPLSQRAASSSSQRSISRGEESLASPAGGATPTRPDSHKSGARAESGLSATSFTSSTRKGKSRSKSNAGGSGHQVTFTVTIVAAVPTDMTRLNRLTTDSDLDPKALHKALSFAITPHQNTSGSPSAQSIGTEQSAHSGSTVNATVQSDEDGDKNKSKRVVSDPKPQAFYHVEYHLLPADTDPIKTDITLFGIAAKIYPERQEAKVMKTWTDGSKTWIAWAHSHALNVTSELLKKLATHKLIIRIWDTRDKFGPKARFDRPRAFKFPSPKPGEDLDDISGVKTLTAKVCKAYLKRLPKLSRVRSLPSVTSPDQKLIKHKQSVDAVKTGGDLTGIPPGLCGMANHITSDNVPCLLLAHPDIEYKVYSKLVELAKYEAQNVDKRMLRQTVNTLNKMELNQNEARTQSPDQDGRTSLPKDGQTGRNSRRSANQSASRTRKQVRDKKTDQTIKEATEYSKKHGVCSMHLNLAPLFVDGDDEGQKISVARLENCVPSLLDGFATISIDRELMTPEQKKELNPLSIKIRSVKNMPGKPLSYEQLGELCHPASLKYSFYGQPEHSTKPKPQAKDIYIDDLKVVLLGPMNRAELTQYLLGPPMEIRVHDRDQIPHTDHLTPILFGEDAEDEKISNVGYISGKRTEYNALKGRPEAWHPYGVSKINMSDFLLGQKVINLQVPVHNCPLPDLLGLHTDHGKVVGVLGSVDGSQQAPLPAGDFLESNTALKIRLEVAFPLVTPEQVAQKPDLPNTTQCPFSRIVYILDRHMHYDVKSILDFVTNVNSRGLGLDNLSPAILDAALSTYKLSVDQQRAVDLDIITGFQILDGKQYIFLLEGLRYGAIMNMWNTLTKPREGITVLYNSDMSFNARLYGTLDVDLTRVKLHQPLQTIVNQPLIYVRDTLPKPSFNALTKLDQMLQCQTLRSAIRNSFFPTADQVISMSREFGVPLTADDLITDGELQGIEENQNTIKSKSALPSVSRTPATRPGHSRVKLKDDLDMTNPRYLEALISRQKTAENMNYIGDNMRTVMLESRHNTVRKVRKPTEHTRMKVPHNYSTHTFNSTELAKDVIRQNLDKDTLYTYNPEFHHSATFVPVNIKEEELRAQAEHRSRFISNKDWSYPGSKTSEQCNQHHKKPNQTRVQDLKDNWTENLDHRNKLDPTVEGREAYSWIDRKYDKDLWTRPPRSDTAPASIMLAGQKLKEEKKEFMMNDMNEWRKKLQVSDASMYFHRLNPQTESTSRGLKAANDLSKLEGIMKDPAQKYSFVKTGLKSAIPALRVVHYPGVDVRKREDGVDVDKLTQENMAGEHGMTSFSAYNPGPYLDKSWTADNNRIPTYVYNHAHEGYFNLYHNEMHNRKLHRTQIQPLHNTEYQNYLFMEPDNGKYNPQLIPVEQNN